MPPRVGQVHEARQGSDTGCIPLQALRYTLASIKHAQHQAQAAGITAAAAAACVGGGGWATQAGQMGSQEEKLLCAMWQQVWNRLVVHWYRCKFDSGRNYSLLRM